jgi:hypothetical protein
VTYGETVCTQHAMRVNHTEIRCSGGLLIREKRSDCASGEPNLWSNLSVFTAIE